MSAAIPAQQPGLRAFVVHDRVPAGCLPFLVTDDDTVPLLRPGDVAVIDTRQREPVERELFLIRYESGPPDRRLKLVETFSRRWGGRVRPGPRDWFTGAYNRPRTLEQIESDAAVRRAFRAVDGPYASDGPHAGYLASKLVGRVVGVLEPSFAEPLRRVGAA